LARKAFFDYRPLSPQEPWDYENDLMMPGGRVFVLDKDISADEIKKYSANTRFIIPVEDGEEEGFINNNRHLREIFSNEDSL